jgi:hypothetical protein
MPLPAPAAGTPVALEAGVPLDREGRSRCARNPCSPQRRRAAVFGTRVDYEWAKSWITDPRKYDPRTKMLIPTALSPDDVDNVRMFVWKTSIEAKGERPGG